jgi:trehalose synthase
VELPDSLLKVYEDTLAANAEELRPVLQEADFVFIHDPQPALLDWLIPERQGKWIWRCHIDLSHPYRRVWKYVRRMVSDYNASIFSLSHFARMLPHTQYLIPPSIDPLSEKNMDLDPGEVHDVLDRFDLDPERPILLQVSRFDRFKDPLGVIQAYRLAAQFTPGLQLVLAGGGAADDPEGAAVLEEVRTAAGDALDIKVLLLPADAHRTINALQRGADIVLQKSLKEGFGLTVTEGMWKGKPVIGGNTGGIRIQVVNHYTGFLVDTPEGAALRIRYLLQDRMKIQEMGRKAKEFVRENFLITRHLRDYLTLMVGLMHGAEGDRIELGKIL